MKHRKHTPGPWWVMTENGTIEIWNQDTFVARVNESHKYHEVNSEANARLIAAAPEMYELLHKLWAKTDPEDKTCWIISDLLSRIDGTKATGGAE